MSDKTFYKVLMVDDDKTLGASLQPQAERYYLDLQQCECWEDAMQALSNKNDFLEWDAIILDARCVDKKGDPADLHFLGTALTYLYRLFERHGNQTPWYVLTAGGKEYFQFVMDGISRHPRDEKAWGEMLYFKDSPADENGKNDIDRLFENIQRVAPLRLRNQVSSLYKETFNAMKSVLKDKGAETLIDILTALHFPESRKNFDPDKEYNQLRKTLESLFYHANQIGLLPDEFAPEGRPNLQESSRYLAGKDPKYNQFQFRYGEEGEFVFPPIIANTVFNLLSVTNTASHINVNQVNLLFGYTLQLCDVIVWYCDYAKNNSDKEANLAKKRPVLKKETELEQRQEADEYEGKIFLLEQDEEGNLHCDKCLVSHKQNQDKIGKKVKLKNVGENKKDGKLKRKYPLFASGVEAVE